MSLPLSVIPIAGPFITEEEIAYVTDAITNGWYDQANDYIHRFEGAFKNYLGRQYAVSLPSCTSGLHLSLLALGVGPGDEVILPDTTWIASAAPVSYVGATPIFADIDPQTWCLSAKTVRPLISERTKAIISVNLYGHMPSYKELLSLGIPLIEDAAESIGSTYQKILSGNFGITSCFSFHGSKTLTTGEGGMLVTDDPEIYQKVMIARDHGRIPGDILFQNTEVGYKYKMSNLQAALGLAQLKRIHLLVSRKQEIFRWYQEVFSDLSSVTLNPDHPDVVNSYWMTTALFQKVSSDFSKIQLIYALKEKGIMTRPFFYPLSSLKAFEKFLDTPRAKEKNKNSYDISRRAINLPSASIITLEDVIRIKNTLVTLMS
jgi:perosamine synthetase